MTHKKKGGKKVVFKDKFAIPVREAKGGEKEFEKQEEERKTQDIERAERDKKISEEEFKKKTAAGIKQSLPEGVEPAEEKRIITEKEISLGLTQADIDIGLGTESLGTVSSAQPLVEGLIGGGIVGAGLKSAVKLGIKGIAIKLGKREFGFSNKVLKTVRSEEQRAIMINHLKSKTGLTKAQATRAWDAAGKKHSKYLAED